MGIFSSKKKVYVSSVVYPLGEDEGPNKREFLKYTVLNATMTSAPSIADSLTQGYLRGQGMALRNCFKYAREHFSEGVPVSSALYLEAPNQDELKAVLAGKHPGSTIDVLTLVVGSADYEWWAEQYLAQEFGYDRVEERFERPPAGVAADAAIAYDLEASGVVRILLMSPGGASKVIDFRPGNNYQPMATFVHCAYQTVQTFDSGITSETRPSTDGETDMSSIDVLVVERTGEIQTTTTRVTLTVNPSNSTTLIKTSKVTEVRSRPQYFLYKLGLGTYPVLDGWVSGGDLLSPYYPAVPLRRDNKDLLKDDQKDTELYKTSKKFLKRLGFDIDDLAESLNENEGVKDVDFAYVAFGVSLNTQSQEGKRYLFDFFQYLRGITSAATTKASFEIWRYNFESNQGSTPPQVNSIEIFNQKNRANNYDIKLQWDYIDTSLKSGVVSPNARVGDVELVMSGTRSEFSFRGMDIKHDNSKLFARRQLTVDTYEELEIAGLVYDNFVYKGKSVTVTAYDAFNDEDEEGFIVPLNQQVLRGMSLRDTTDLAYQCCHMVLNCYKVVKQKWYQRGVFKVILMIVAVVLMVFFPPAGVAAIATMLVGALGISLLLATILAAVVYMLAAMIVMNILTKVAVKLFGEKWGAVIAVLIAFVAGNWDSLMSIGTNGLTAMQLINGSAALLNAYGNYVQQKTLDIYKDIGNLEAEYEKKFNELEDMWEKMLGTNTDLLDIQAMTQATYIMQFEALDTFLGRTLLTGGDIAEITLDQVTNFTALGLQLPTIG